MQATLNTQLAASLANVTVVPVLTIEDAASAVALGRALVAGGLHILEVTLRTPAAMQALAQMARELPDAIIGAGTVLTPAQGQAAIKSGAKFLVSPGITPTLIQAAQAFEQPLLPGAATASEAMALADLGYTMLKFFPAEQAGGVAYLKALSQPLSQIKFCPTGGVNASNAKTYLGCPNVVCVGGSWVAPADLVAAGDWAGITALANAASGMR